MIDDLGVDRQIRHTALRHDRDFPDSGDLTQALFNTRKIVRFVTFEPNGETFQQRGCRTGQRQHQPQNHANGREKENPRPPPTAAAPPPPAARSSGGVLAADRERAGRARGPRRRARSPAGGAHNCDMYCDM